MESASPWPRLISALSYQVKHLLDWLEVLCCGSTSWNAHRSAYLRQPELVKYVEASWVHPCSRTTSGRPAGRPSGRYEYMLRFPGLEPNPVTGVSVAA